MAPIRRYLRITKYSVLEVRIYLDQPADAAWLLSSRDPVLPRIMQAVRPKVLPKLREENEYATNGKRKSAAAKKKRGIKDVAAQDDFEVSIFLKDSSTRHSLITKRKAFSDKPRLQSTSNRLTGTLSGSDHAIHIDDDEEKEEHVPNLRQEQDGEEHVDLTAIPDADVNEKRQGSVGRRGQSESDRPETEDADEAEEALFVSSSDEEFFQTQKARPEPTQRRRRRRPGAAPRTDPQTEGVAEQGQDDDDKKKLGLKTTYDGFSIYGRILCLIVRRKGGRRPKTAADVDAGLLAGSQMMEQWVSTQVGQENGLDDGT